MDHLYMARAYQQGARMHQHFGVFRGECSQGPNDRRDQTENNAPRHHRSAASGKMRL